LRPTSVSLIVVHPSSSAYDTPFSRIAAQLKRVRT
jgi:hypothetical protein